MHEAFFLASRSAAPMVRFPFDLEIGEVLSLIGDGVVSIDQHGRIILFNRAAEDLFGYTSDEVLGCAIEVLIPMRFHDVHQKDVDGFVLAATPTHRSMGGGREVSGRHKNGREFPMEATLSRHMFAGQPIFMAVVRDVTEQKTAEQQRRLIAGEVAHRLRNTMAVFSSIISLTGRDATSLPDFVNSLLGRLIAVSRTNDALIGEKCIDTSLRNLLESELAAFQHGDAGFTLTGPDVRIEGKLALDLGLIFHELATNAAKFGAFSVSGGKIQVNWHIDAERSPTLKLSWQETGGPMVKAPTKNGFGRKLLDHALKPFNGATKTSYDADGVSCMISVPLADQKITAPHPIFEPTASILIAPQTTPPAEKNKPPPPAPSSS